MRGRSERKHPGTVIAAGMLLAVILGLSGEHGFAAMTVTTEPDKAAVQECMLKELETAKSGTTVDQIRAKCQAGQMAAAEKEEDAGIVDVRYYTDEGNILRPFTLMAYRPNYILLASYNNNPNNDVYHDAGIEPDNDLNDFEAQFQVSIKVPLAVDLFKKNVDIFAAYTARSFWQVYNKDISSPFRETNYEPEAWVQFRPNWTFWGFRNVSNAIGFNHQSNGRSEPLSRSWNRIFANFVFEKGNLAFAIRPWYRIPEDDKDDNNPDITDYMGHYAILAAYKWKEHVFTIMSRNNLESGFSKGAVEATWGFPLGSYKYLKGYVQGFTGYGQSLIDYDYYQSTIGIGFAITDWL
ncbi:MAG: phospholipase A [Desulfobulbales bacterium]|jgi:phospholipase A1